MLLYHWLADVSSIQCLAYDVRQAQGDDLCDLHFVQHSDTRTVSPHSNPGYRRSSAHHRILATACRQTALHRFHRQQTSPAVRLLRALPVAAWARDVRGPSGDRPFYRAAYGICVVRIF